MSATNRSTPRSSRPQYGQSSTSARATLAFIAVVLSGTLLGGMLSLFEACAADAALLRAASEVPSIAKQAVEPAARGGRSG